MKKKMLTMIFAAFMALALAGCGGSGTTNAGGADTGSAPAAAEAETGGAEDDNGDKVYQLGETWEVDGQWKITLDSVEEVEDRNEYSDLDPAAVYLVEYTYENLGFDDGIMDGLYVSLDLAQVVDAEGKMGYEYPGDVTKYPDEVPIGASITAQCVIGVDNPGNFKVIISQYDGNDVKQTATFAVDVE